MTAGQAFVWMDRFLDAATVGPRWLQQEEWQSKSYDHMVRSDEKFQKIKDYIEQNPVKAVIATWIIGGLARLGKLEPMPRRIGAWQAEGLRYVTGPCLPALSRRIPSACCEASSG
jgi:hypothetical protein